jgi:hypothetical protein
MKHSKPLSASTLIALALLLGAAASWSDEKSWHQATHHQSTGKNQSAYSPQPPTIIVEPAPVKIIQPASAEKQTTKQKWYQRPSITDWGVLVVTTVYASISLGLLQATRRQAQLAQDTLTEIRKTAIASEVAANATRDSVQVSKSTVRPYVWVRKVEGQNDVSGQLGLGPEFAHVIDSANCIIQNLGKGPAFITEVVAKLKFSSAPLPCPPVFNDCVKVTVLQPVVTESEPTNFFIRGQGADSQTAVRMGDPSGPERFSCYGIIKYRDAFGESYSVLRFERDLRYLLRTAAHFVRRHPVLMAWNKTSRNTRTSTKERPIGRS